MREDFFALLRLDHHGERNPPALQRRDANRRKNEGSRVNGIFGDGDTAELS